MKKFRFKKKNFYSYRTEEEKTKIKESSETYTTSNYNKYEYFKYLNKKNRKKKFLNIFFLSILILQTIYIIKLYFPSNKIKSIFNISKNINITSKNIPNIEIKNMSREEAIKYGKEYVEICRKGILINNKKFIKSKKPLISVIIPVYNSEKVIKTTIRSIQNQNMTDIEIILVNDCPTDNTTKIIEKMQIEDPRIKIIYNNKSMGTLYSRSIGVLEAKGKYITCLDDDDLFIDKYLYDIIYNETDNEYFDIVAFKAFDTHGLKTFEDDYLAENKNSKTLYQPELGIFSFRRSDPLFHNNILVWGKIIRTIVYKAAVNLMGKKRYSNYLLWCEDTSIFFIICNLANSYKFVEKYGIFHFLYKTSGSLLLSKDHLMFGDIFLIDIIFDFSKNEYKKNAIYKLFEIKYRDYFHLSKANETVKTYFKEVFKKIINCHYIEEKDKKELKNKFKDHKYLFN